ncbi:MAG: hypothetical protein K0S18_40 [Anaerocolumna sp.]|jgi:plasmid replication initiation protein|nr:hypothetical protein [Anaerocolumna sp.]
MRFKDYKAMLHKEERMLNRIHTMDMSLNGGDELVDIYDITIPENFKLTKPKRKKIYRAFNYFIRNGFFDKPISVIIESNENGKANRFVLVDGYSRYVAARWMYMRFIPVKYIDINDVIIK